MTDKQLFSWLGVFILFTCIGTAGILYSRADKVGMPDDDTIAVATSPVHVAEQAAKTYLINGVNLDGHLYYIIRLRNTDEFQIKHGASCPGQHGSGFFDG